MPRDVQVASENEEVWFPHPANPANLYFHVTVSDGVLKISGRDCAYGAALLKWEIQPNQGTLLISIPTPPHLEPERKRKERERLEEAAPELYATLEQITQWAGGMDAERLPAPWPEMVHQAQAALAKARGEQPALEPQKMQRMRTSDLLASGLCQCWKCGKTGHVLDEFTSPYTGLCAECSKESRAENREHFVMPNWTPGPWERPEDGHYVRAANGTTVITGYDNDNENIAADFTLASAAPELYAALDAILPYTEPNWGFLPEKQIAIEHARAALAKARGEQPPAPKSGSARTAQEAVEQLEHVSVNRDEKPARYSDCETCERYRDATLGLPSARCATCHRWFLNTGQFHTPDRRPEDAR